jgi:ankyrin repeat protein
MNARKVGIQFVPLICLFGLSSVLAAQPGPIQDIKILKAACSNDLETVRACVQEDPSSVALRDYDNRTPLHYAAAHGAIDVMRFLLDHGAPINAQTKMGVTPENWAIENRHLDALLLLLKHHPNLELPRHDLGSEIWPSGRNRGLFEQGCLLHSLNAKVPEEYIEALIDGGADVNAVDPACLWTPLMMAAAKYRGTKIMRELLDRGAKIDWVNDGGNPTLEVALYYDNVDQVKLLLESGADPTIVSNENDHWPQNCRRNMMSFAAQTGNIECIKLLAAYGAPIRLIDGEGHDPNSIAAANHHDEAVEFLSRVDASAKAGWTPAHFAAEFGYPEAFKLLKQRDQPLDVRDEDGNTPLLIAASKGDPGSCEALVNLGADVKQQNAEGNTALHMAAHSGSAATVSVLLGLGASPGVTNRKGQTAAVLATGFHSEDIVRLLATASKSSELIKSTPGPDTPSAKLKLAIGAKKEGEAMAILDANPNLSSERYGKDWTPLHLAAYYNEPKLIQDLLSKKCPLEARTDTGWTPLMLAAQQGSAAAAKALLEAKADPNLQAKSGRTALHLAAQENRGDCIDLLRKYGAKRTIKDAAGLTALMIADKLGNSDASKALRG